MLQHTPEPIPLTASRSPWLRGHLSVPGDPLQSQLALILAGLARGRSVISNISLAPGVDALARVLERLGIGIAREGDSATVEGLGLGMVLDPEGPVDLSGLGDGAALLVGLLGAHDFDTTLVGLTGQPGIDPILDYLRRNGAKVERSGATATLRGPRFAVPLDLALSDQARGLVAPFLVHGLAVAGTSTLHLPPGVDDPAQSLMSAFGARILATDGQVMIEGRTPLTARSLKVPGDATIAAFAAAAGLVAPDSEVTIDSVAIREPGLTLLDALELFGADLSFAASPTGTDITAKHRKLTAATIPSDLALGPSDLVLLSVVAAFAEGETLIEAIGEGSPRGNLTRALRANGAQCMERPGGGIAIVGQARVPGGGNVMTRLDPKLAMAFLVLGLGADKPVTIEDGAVMDGLFPGFVRAFEHMGASFTGPQ